MDQERGILGGFADVMSAPRRGLWGLLGLPEYGNQLLAKYAGMDENSMLTHALGMGAEIATDPLTWAGALAGGPLAKLLGRGGAAAATSGDEVAALAAAHKAAQAGLAERAALEAETLAAQMGRGPGINSLDVPGILSGQETRHAMAHRAALDELHNVAGIPSFPNQALVVPSRGKQAVAVQPAALPPHAPPGIEPGVVIPGRTDPPGFASIQQTGTYRGRKIGSAFNRIPGNTDPLPMVLPDEWDMMNEVAQRLPGFAGTPDTALAALEGPAGGVFTGGGTGAQSVIDTVLRRGARDVSRAQSMPRLGEVLPTNLPTSWNQALGYKMPGMFLDEAATQTQAALADALQRQAASKAEQLAAHKAATTLTDPDLYKLAGAGFLGTYSGGQIGNEALYGRR